MSHYILYYKGAYNIYSTIIDRPLFEKAVTLKQLEQYIKEEEGNQGMQRLSTVLEQAHKKGTSSMFHTSLVQGVEHNHAGKNGTCLSTTEFIEHFLVLKDENYDSERNFTIISKN